MEEGRRETHLSSCVPFFTRSSVVWAELPPFQTARWRSLAAACTSLLSPM